MVTMSKKKMTVILLAALVVLTAVGVTLALYMGVLAPKVNHFSMKTDGVVDGEIKEEGWDENTNDPTKAIPGQDFEKGVVVINKSDVTDMYIYVGLKMEIKKGPENGYQDLAAGDLAKILAVMIPNFRATNEWYNAADWDRVDPDTGNVLAVNAAIKDTEYFVYKVRVAQGAQTNRLFDEVKIKAAATPSEMKAVADLGGFNIVMSGAVVQGDVNDTMTPEIKANLIGLLDGSVTP